MNSQRETGKGECLTEDLISGYLEGVLSPVVKAACEVHLIGCDRCREKLARFMRLLRRDIDPEEEAEINRATAQWDRRNLQPVPKISPPAVRKRIYYGLGGVAAVFLVLAFLFRGFLFWGPTAEDVIQALLAKDRPFDAQLSGQPYRALTITRSSGDDLQFELLTEEMTKRAADAYRWGRFYLVKGDYDKAIEQLQAAVRDSKAPSEVHNDLGVGYLLRYASGDFERSRQEFGAALAQDEVLLPAIFNLGLLYERNGMIPEAEQQWKRYLELDSETGWAQEVRDKLSRKDLAR